eukprot:snap_masked-scaffold1459_size40432-processed-gene-0.5 protein:Tk02620 transcript:snap_masked-scaffold1459_size40432-processed-gene-0.5-mRNA-1 annotation:"glutamate decarboxylase-like protein 1"
MAAISQYQSHQAEEFLQKIKDLVSEKKLLPEHFDNKGEKVVSFVHPKDLEEKLGLAIHQEGAPEPQLEEICQNVVKYSVKTGASGFYNQLYHGVDTFGLAGSWLSDALNTNNHTFEVAPVFIVTERSVIQYIMKKFGFTKGDGIFSPGGSTSNMYGMVLARHRMFPEIKQKGLLGSGKPLVVYTSEESHYSIVKGANWLGLGTDNVVKVGTDDQGRLDPQELEKAIQKSVSNGQVPFFVNATSGSTVMGAYDDLEGLASICQAHGIWLHVDACWGGSAIMSNKHKHLLRGSHLADSIAWNPHKMLGAPLQCSPFITRHSGLLHEANCASATYLFQQDKFYDVTYDTGDKSIQCGRKVDGFKLWFMLKARGESYFEQLVDNAFDQANYLHHLIQSTPGFRPAFDFGFNCTNVCFEYLPERFRGQVETEQWQEDLSHVPPMIKENMIKKGTLMIGYQPLPFKGKRNFFRM